MAICEDELIAKLKRGESIASVRMWFLDELSHHDLLYSELSPFEQAFLNQICISYEARLREQEDARGRLN